MLARSWQSGIPAAAAIWAGYDFEEVTVWILEIDSAPTVVVIDFTFYFLRGIGPVGQLPIAHPADDCIELGLADQEGIVLWRNLATRVHVVEIGVIPGRHHMKWSPMLWHW